MILPINNKQPLYSLTIGEYVQLTQQIIQTIIQEELQKLEQPKIEDEQHFNIQECAKFLNCSIVSIHSYKKTGLPFYRIGRTVMFKKSEVLAFMQVRPKEKKNSKRSSLSVSYREAA